MRILVIPVVEKGAEFLLPADIVFFEGKSQGNKERDDQVSRLQVVGLSLPHPLKVANVIVLLNVTRLLAPVFVFVPVVDFLFPARMSWALDLGLMLAWAPVDRSFPGASLAPLPGGGRKRLG
jgi:hypothetical protein